MAVENYLSASAGTVISNMISFRFPHLMLNLRVLYILNARCSAVFGGIYCLKRPIQGIKIDSDGQAIGIESQGQTLQAKFFLIEDCLNPQAIVKSGFSRAILVIDR